MSDTTPRQTLDTAHGLPMTDADRQETREWIESLEAVVHHHGIDRARYLLGALIDQARRVGAAPAWPWVTDYVNTLPAAKDPAYPGDEVLERRITAINRWNAAMMVHRANKKYPGLGGHISTYGSSAVLYEVGLNHYFRGKEGVGTGDALFYQGHGAPGMYARSFLEGRLSKEKLDHFRRETERGAGLSSYPHPRLMPDYWEFPTVSMGLGPINSIYQARFNRYLHHRGIVDTSASRVWAFLGDGEMDEPESQGALSLAGREGLDNLTFVINCNLQRLDGPVRGNGKILQEMESVFRGAGWNVIKVVWGRAWDSLFAADTDGILTDALNRVVDGDWQTVAADPIPNLRTRFFDKDPRLAAFIAGMSDEDLLTLEPGGHDRIKVNAAYAAAVAHEGQPTVILVQTVKGNKLGSGFQGRNSTHQKKSFSNEEELREFRDNLGLEIADADLASAPFFHPGPDSVEVRYLAERRAALGGPLPSRRTSVAVDVSPPEPEIYAEFLQGSDGKEFSTTMAFARILNELLRHKEFGKRVVPIIPDEARTFGMDPYFRQYGIYASKGQLYEPVDKKQLLFYREAQDGQVLQEGITEAGSMASFIAAGTTYATHGEPMVPFYIFYSMFGFQRTGDQAWLFGDMRGRGFLMAGTAGRTTLNGEGLQHEDGHSHVLAATVPNIEAYDPAFAFELAIIVQEGLRRMVQEEEDIFYYVTLQNENYAHPVMPEGVNDGVVRGLYRAFSSKEKSERHVQLFGSGTIMNQVLAAQKILDERFDITADVWSATSYQRLRRDALSCERWNRLNPTKPQRIPYVVEILGNLEGPFIAASDYMKLVPEQIARWVPGTFIPLGTDGYGMSDTREALRRHFEVDAEAVVIATLDALMQDGRATAEEVSRAITELGYDREKLDPVLDV